ncbi:MAG: PVC-type heme-binding CxxCH protein [Roseibacillus sp.]
MPTPRPLLLLASCSSFLASLSAAPFELAKPIEGANGVVMKEFAKEPFLRNTVGICVDEKGRVYATSVVRRKAADLDIRQFRQWIETDLSLRSVDEKRAFYHRELTAQNSARYKRIGDQNKDGTVDWHDLTVLSDRIIRIVDHDQDGVADEATVYADNFNTEVTGIAAGVTAWDGKIYATIEPDAWVLEDKDDDGKSDTRTSLAYGYSVHVAYAGHNFSGPVLGPDGRIYFSSPDKGMNVTSKEGVNYAHPNSGTITRCELDGSHLEVFAYGLRNAQEPAFDQHGNLFGVDNDGDMKGEKERLLYIVEGSDTGWRCNWQYRGGDYQIWQEEGLYLPEHPKQAAYIVPCIRTYHDGPTGFAFNPGTALNDFYKDHFFMTGFPGRKLYAFKVKEKGASFEMTGDHVVASGVLMTGINFGPEGALYIADWSAKGYELNEKGGVWRMDDPKAADSNLRKGTAGLLRGDWKIPPVAKVAEALEHPDQRVRMKAQFELVRRKEEAALVRVAGDSGKDVLARIHALWGLGQLHRHTRNLGGDPLTSFLSDPEPEVRAQAAKVISEVPALRKAATGKLMVMLSDAAPRPRFFAAIALGRLKSADCFDPLVAYLARDGAEPYHRHAGMMGLLGCATPTQLAGLANHKSKPARLAAVVALRRLRALEAVAFLSDGDPMVVAEAARSIHDDESIPGALPPLAKLLERGENLEEAAVRRALSAAIRLRKPEFAGLVANYAANDSHPEELRSRALELLNQWCKPPRLDSVEGRYRPLPPVAPHEIRPAVRASLEKLTASSKKGIADRARRAAAVYGIGTDPKKLLATIMKDRPEAADALRLLATGDEPSYAGAAEMALRSEHASVRAVALEAMAALNPGQLPTLATKALKDGELVEQRTALTLLGNSAEPGSAELLAAALEGLRSGAGKAALALDALEAAQANKSPKARAAVAAYLAAKDSQDPLSPYLETLTGGDPVSGKAIFNTHVAAQCVRCHRVDGPGSNVGPGLAKIGAKEPRYLLESLVVPGAVVAPGYGITTIDLKSGKSITAPLAGEDAKQVTLVLPDGGTRSIAKSEIASRTKPVSSMLPMGLLLQKRELRDVMAYLQSLK